MQHRMVERGVVRHLSVVGAPGDGGEGELLVPTRLQRGAGGVEVVAAAGLGPQVRPRPAETGVGQPHLEGDLRRGRAEADPRTLVPAAVGSVARTAAQGRTGPGAVRGERLVELGGEIHGVLVVAGAEAAVVHLAFQGVVTDHPDVGVQHRHVGLARVEQDVVCGTGGEGVALPAGPVGGGHLGVDAVLGQAHPVVARRAGLVCVRERGGVCRVVAGGHRTGRRHDRQLAHDAAADPGQVGLTEAVDGGAVVVVATLTSGVGADLHHAERRTGSRKGVAEIRGADERIDQAGAVNEGSLRCGAACRPRRRDGQSDCGGQGERDGDEPPAGGRPPGAGRDHRRDHDCPHLRGFNRA